MSVPPVSPLAASTRYTFTITPPSTLGDPYSFDFTTGAGPDTTPPQLIGFDPKSGTSGTGISGPFPVMFNKRLLSTAIRSHKGIAVKADGNSTVQTGLPRTADGTGLA